MMFCVFALCVSAYASVDFTVWIQGWVSGYINEREPEFDTKYYGPELCVYKNVANWEECREKAKRNPEAIAWTYCQSNHDCIVIK
ncbi:hypothetical protein [Marinifilum sp.]|uniref:hypothetical protein n=1 Tax=Marinifilum sp. TaxID=2033137 RepID=UPI003BAC43AC